MLLYIILNYTQIMLYKLFTETTNYFLNINHTFIFIYLKVSKIFLVLNIGHSKLTDYINQRLELENAFFFKYITI